MCDHEIYIDKNDCQEETSTRILIFCSELIFTVLLCEIYNTGYYICVFIRFDNKYNKLHTRNWKLS